MIDFARFTGTIGGQFWDAYTHITSRYGLRFNDDDKQRADRLIALAPDAVGKATEYNRDPTPIVAAKRFAQSYRKIGNSAQVLDRATHKELQALTELLHDCEIANRRKNFERSENESARIIAVSAENRDKFYKHCVGADDIIAAMIDALRQFHVTYYDRVRAAPIGQSPRPEWSNWESAIRSARTKRAAEFDPQIGATIREWMRAVRNLSTTDNIPLNGITDEHFKRFVDLLITDGRIVEKCGVCLLADSELGDEPKPNRRVSRKRGRPRKANLSRRKAQQILAAWDSGAYSYYKQLAPEFDMTEIEIARAIDTERKARKRDAGKSRPSD